MLSDRRVHATLPAQDIERAKAFYKEKLGLSPEREAPGGLVYRSGDSLFLVFPTQGSPSGTHTQVGFTVPDLEAEVAELKKNGLEFETYDFPQFDKAKGYADFGSLRSAWFKDSEGNLIGLVQFLDDSAGF
jgi:predicted enzyme related to lactoylglutathione lyase